MGPIKDQDERDAEEILMDVPERLEEDEEIELSPEDKKAENGTRKGLRNVQNGSPGAPQAPSETRLDPPGDPGRVPDRRKGDPRGQGGSKPRSARPAGHHFAPPPPAP